MAGWRWCPTVTFETLTTPVRSFLYRGLVNGTPVRWREKLDGIITDEHKHWMYFYNIMNSPKISAPAPTIDAAAVDACQLYSSANGDVHYKSPLKSLIRSDLTDSVVVT